jgi:hypothetical protein
MQAPRFIRDVRSGWSLRTRGFEVNNKKSERAVTFVGKLFRSVFCGAQCGAIAEKLSMRHDLQMQSDALSRDFDGWRRS